jgi:hypothetical protein
MDRNHDTRLTSGELAGLWGQYINDTAATSVLTYFLANVEDAETRKIIEIALQSAQSHVTEISEIFLQEKFPIPFGFTEKDVNMEAPRLFSDPFYLLYLKNMSVLGMTANTMAIGLGAKSDIVSFHKKVLSDAVSLQKMSSAVLLEKGLYIRPPYIPQPEKTEMVHKQSFLGNLIGGQRPLTAIEISHLFLNIQTNVIGKDMMMAFAQVAKRNEVKQYLLRGKKIASKQIDIFSQILLENDLPAAMVWDSVVTDSTTPTFSDKLLMFHVTAMSAAGVGNYGAAMAASPRRDIGLKYARLLTEIAFYAEEGANIMIDHGWLEKPPQAPDRNQLVNQ